MYAAVELDGKIYRVKLTVREQADKNKTNVAYSYEVVEIELSDGSPYATDATAVQPLSDAPNNSISLAKLLKNVRMSYAEAGKEANFLLDESRKRDEKDKARMTVAETVNAVAAELRDKFGVEVEVVESLNGVKNEQAREAIDAGKHVKGWYDPETGKVYIYVPNAESGQDVMATYAHEVVAHKGMRGLLGEERYNELCERLGEALTPEQRELVQEYIDMGKSDGELGDEYIARIAEMLIDEKGNIKEPTTWEKIKGAVREFFREVFGLELTDADTRYLLWRSGERLRRNNADVSTRAQDVVTGEKLKADAAQSKGSSIRFAIGKKRKEDMRKGLRNKLTHASEEDVERTITEIEKLGEQSKAGGDARVEKAALHWAQQGTIILPEDGPKVLKAVKIAADKGIDFTQYDSPMRLIEENTNWKKRADVADPDKVATLSGKRALGDTGITIYDVEDSEQGQRDMRTLWNGTWGKERECPWCLLHDDGHGGVSAEAKAPCAPKRRAAACRGAGRCA